MKLEIFEPTMCCSTGICGPSVDEKLIKISENLELIKREFKEVIVERYQPQTHYKNFASNAEVIKLVRENGQKVLPIITLDGKIIKISSYPTLEELQSNLRGE